MRTISKTEATIALLGSIVLALAFLARGVPSDRIPVSIDPLYADAQAVPFASVRPTDFEPTNPATSDTAMVFYPWLVFMAEAIHDGELPLWTPLSGGGLPMMGNLSSAVFFPTTWLSFVPSIGVGRGMFYGAVLRLAVAGLFGFLLLRRLGAGRLPSALGGALSMLFGYQIVWLFYSLSNVACLLPLCLYLADRFALESNAKNGAWCALALALQFLGGHAETSLALGIAFSAWVLGRGGFAVALRFIPYGIASLALCSFQLLPFLEYLGLSKGQQERLGARGPTPEHWDALHGFGIAASLGVVALLAIAWWCLRRRGTTPLRDSMRGLVGGVAVAAAHSLLTNLGMRPLLGLLFDPDRFGNPVGLDPSPYRGPEYFPDVNGAYIGACAALLALLYFLVGTKRSIARITFGLTVFGLGFACELEPLHALVRLLPGFDMAAGTRMLPLVGMSGAIAAALALADVLTERSVLAEYRGAALRVLVASCVAFGLSNQGGSANGIPSSLDWYGDPGIAVRSPAPGARLEPRANDKAGTELLVRFEGVADGDATSVTLEIGEGRLGPLPVRDGRFEALWPATRVDAGVYSVLPVARHPDGAQVAGKSSSFEIVRASESSQSALARIAIACLVLVLLLGWPCVGSAGVVLACVLGESFVFGFAYNPFSKCETVFPSTPLTDHLAAEKERALADGSGPFRVLCEDVILQPNMNHAYGLEVVRAYDQLELAAFDHVLQWLTRGASAARFNAETIDFSSPLFQLFNLAYVVTARDLSALPNLERVPLEAGERAVSGRLYRNRAALPRAFLVGSAERFDPARTAELLGKVTSTAILDVEPPAPLGGSGTVKFVETARNRVSLDVDASAPAMLILTDNWYPGWRAKVDGADVEILRSHLTFRCVRVPAGKSRVEFEYRPRSFSMGLLLSGLGLVGLILALGGRVFRRES